MNANYCNCPDCRTRNCPAGKREVELEREITELRADKAKLWLALEKYRCQPDKYGKDSATKALGGAK